MRSQRFIWARLRMRLNLAFISDRIGDYSALVAVSASSGSPLDRLSPFLGGSRPNKRQMALQHIVAIFEDLDIPFPRVQRISDPEKPLLPWELQLVQGFPQCFSAKALESLTAETNDVTEIT